MKIVLLTFVSLFGVFILFFLWASYPWKLQAFERSDEIKAGPVPAQSQPTALNILTWNISYAYGLGSGRRPRHGHAKAEKQQKRHDSAFHAVGLPAVPALAGARRRVVISRPS